MDSGSSLDNSTTPLKNEGSSVVAMHQLLGRGGNNPYKTPVQQHRFNSTGDINFSKKNSYKGVIIEKMPIYSPPSENHSFIKNPFEHGKLLKERLSQPMCSPSLFKSVSSPAQNDDFTWSIEDISMLHPADIDENPAQDFESWFSPVTESEAQKAINRFFSSQVVGMESPIKSEKKKNSLIKKEKKGVLTLDMWTQTNMTLPPVLPPDVEAILSRYCIFGGGSQNDLNESELNTSSGSRKKLLFRNCNYFSPERKFESDACISTPLTTRPASPELSPVTDSSPMDISMRDRSSVRLNLSKDIATSEKENLFSKDWKCQGCSTPRAVAHSCDSAFSSM